MNPAHSPSAAWHRIRELKPGTLARTPSGTCCRAWHACVLLLSHSHNSGQMHRAGYGMEECHRGARTCFMCAALSFAGAIWLASISASSDGAVAHLRKSTYAKVRKTCSHAPQTWVWRKAPLTTQLLRALSPVPAKNTKTTVGVNAVAQRHDKACMRCALCDFVVASQDLCTNSSESNYTCNAQQPHKMKHV